MFARRILIAYTVLFSGMSTFSAHYDLNPEDVAGYHYQAPTIQGNLDNFADEDVIVLYRGINLLPANFDNASRRDFIATSQVNEPMFAPATYEKAGEEFGSDEYNELEAWGRDIAALIDAL